MSQVLDRVRNGVDTAQMYGTLDAIKSDPSLARFQFRVQNRWIDGAHNRSIIQGFYGAGQEDVSRAQAFSLDAGEPAVLLGVDTGPNPAEALLHALAACLTTSLVYVAAARKASRSCDWLDAVPSEALASFAGVGHMLDLAAIEPGDTVLRSGPPPSARCARWRSATNRVPATPSAAPA